MRMVSGFWRVSNGEENEYEKAKLAHGKMTRLCENAGAGGGMMWKESWEDE